MQLVYGLQWDSSQGPERPLCYLLPVLGIWSILVNWKLAHITLIFKKGKKDDGGNQYLKTSDGCSRSY